MRKRMHINRITILLCIVGVGISLLIHHGGEDPLHASTQAYFIYDGQAGEVLTMAGDRGGGTTLYTIQPEERAKPQVVRRFDVGPLQFDPYLEYENGRRRVHFLFSSRDTAGISVAEIVGGRLTDTQTGSALLMARLFDSSTPSHPIIFNQQSLVWLPL